MLLSLYNIKNDMYYAIVNLHGLSRISLLRNYKEIASSLHSRTKINKKKPNICIIK